MSVVAQHHVNLVLGWVQVIKQSLGVQDPARAGYGNDDSHAIENNSLTRFGPALRSIPGKHVEVPTRCQ
jgi:hypothetical protein